MRLPPAFLCYLVQAWTATPYRQAQREPPARAASRARHTRASRHRHRVRRLPAVVCRKPAVPGGGSP